MNHLSAKTLIAAVATVGLIGTVAPAAVAGPPADKPGHAAKAERDAAKSERNAARDAAKSERNTAREGAKADKVDARVDRLLNRLAESTKLAALGEDVEGLVRSNIEADKTGDAAVLRPSTYRLIINQLHFAERLLEAAEVAADADATTAVQTVVDELVTFTAGTEKAELRRTKRSLQEWAQLVEDDADEDDAGDDDTELEDETETELEDETETEDPVTV